MSIWEELRQAAVKLRAAPACPDPDSCGGCVDSELVAIWLEHTADNMQDEDAREVTGYRADGTTYTQVHIDGDHHVGLPSEWTAALEAARKINALDVATIVPAEPVISEDARKILDALNGFADSLDPNVTEALDWAMRQPEVASTDGPNAEGEYQVELLDFSAIEWRPSENRWAVTVSDDTDSEVSQ